MNSRQKVLLIDDEQSVCDVVSDYFDKAGYEVVIARSGAEGIEKSQSARPDIIILDLMLPIWTDSIFAEICAKPRVCRL